MLFLRRELITNWAAPDVARGAWRGTGLPHRAHRRYQYPRPADGVVGFGRPHAVSRPQGAAGGGDGSHGWIAVNDLPIEPTSAPEVSFRPGDLVRLKVPGGGGHGDPARRSAKRLAADLRDGYVTPDGASRDYGTGD